MPSYSGGAQKPTKMNGINSKLKVSVQISVQHEDNIREPILLGKLKLHFTNLPAEIYFLKGITRVEPSIRLPV